MNIFRKQFRRGAISTALLVLLLAIGVAFCSIGASAWFTTRSQIADMKKQYTTVAVPIGQSGNVFSSVNSLFGVTTEEMWTPLTEQEDHQYPGLLAEDVRGFLMAHVSGCASVSPYERYEPENYTKSYFYDGSSCKFDSYNNSLMVLALRCTSVSDLTDSDAVYDRAVWDDSGEIIGYEKICEKQYTADFVLEEAVCRFPGYETIPGDVKIWFSSWLYTEDGQIPFEPGKTYLLFGNEGGVTMEYGDLVETEIDGEVYQVTEEVLSEQIAVDNIISMGNVLPDEGNEIFSWHSMKDDAGMSYHVLDEDSPPFYAEYEGDWRDFLQSEEGTTWREEIIPWCRLNYESASVILTDNIDSLYMFNNGDADVLEGRKFQEEEYTKGDAVCMVSAAYAMKNDLSVGDAINLDLYRSEMSYTLETVGNIDPDIGVSYVPIWTSEPCASKNRIDVKKDYTIVGIYTAPEFQSGWHSFQADTIFVPKASVPNAEKYERRFKVPMYSIILENGMEDEFEAYVSDMGYGGQFAYSDQGYHEALESFKALSENALRLMLGGIGAFFLTAMLFFFLISRQVRQTVFRVRQLGMGQKETGRELRSALATLVFTAALIGAGLGYASYGTVTGRALEGEIPVRPWMILACAAVLAFMLLLAAHVHSGLTAGCNLMGGFGGKRKRKGKCGSGRTLHGKGNLAKVNTRETNRKSGGTLLHVMFVGMWRRKKASLLLVLVAAVSVFFAVFVQNLAARQEAAIERMIRDTAVQCVVTDAHGACMDHLQMPNAFVEMLAGRRHWQDCFVDEYVKNVRAKASERLEYPQDVTLRRILNFASDSALGAAEGCEIRMLDGWTQEAFSTEEKVCLIPEGMWTRGDEDGISWVDVNLGFGQELQLQVIGIVSGGPGNVVWCPFFLQREDGASELFWVDSCSFDIADNMRIEECKAAIYEIFVEPGPAVPEEEWAYGVLVQEETYQNTLEKLKSNLFLLNLLLPLLTFLCVVIGLLAGYLTTRTRVREFAVMRCLGMRQGTIFWRTLGECFLLSAIGALVGGGAGFCIERVVSSGALWRAGVMLGFFLAGTAISVWNTTRVNVMELMKTEE